MDAMLQGTKETAVKKWQLLRITLISMSVFAMSVVPNWAGSEQSQTAREWNFDTFPAGTLPEGFHVGTLFDGRPAGEWKVMKTKQAASSPHVLGQLMNKGAEHAYKVVLVKEITASNLDLQVSFLAVGGKGDMGGGLIWRATDDRNYYLTRANPLEQNIRLYRVVNGVRTIIANSDRTIDVRKWHRLRVVTTGCRIQVSYDDTPVFDHCDRTFTAGHIGLWTKSDAVTYFDDLRVSVIQE